MAGVSSAVRQNLAGVFRRKVVLDIIRLVGAIKT
jgi:hypothetical protein